MSAVSSSSSSPININSPDSRRRSFLDVGGRNSINNFVSSFQRAQSFSGLNLFEPAIDTIDDISPLTSPPITNGEFGEPDNNRIFDTLSRQGTESEQINNFEFPQDENSSLLLGRQNSKLSNTSERLISGNSTAPQTIFNSINTLMGIAMLSLPFGFKLCGWILGTLLLLSSAIVTDYTGKILGKIMRKYPHLTSYGDIANLYGGGKAQFIITLIFSIDLFGATISLILIFSDSFSLLFPDISIKIFKSIIILILFITSFIPLHIISFLSIFGVVCTSGVLIAIIVSGLLTREIPGSLLKPASTYLFPNNLNDVLLSLGIMMAPWGGHIVLPELIKDMKHPSKYSKCCDIAFSFSFALYYLISSVGFLMEGSNCEDSLIKNIMLNKNNSKSLILIICSLMGLLSISKIPLVTRPLITVYENLFSLNFETEITYQDGVRQKTFSMKRFIGRVLFTIFILILSFTFTSFGQVIAFLGSAICFTVCITLPLLFYLKLFNDELSQLTKLAIKVGILISISGAIIGTYSSFVYDTSI